MDKLPRVHSSVGDAKHGAERESIHSLRFDMSFIPVGNSTLKTVKRDSYIVRGTSSLPLIQCVLLPVPKSA